MAESVYKDEPCTIEHRCPWGAPPAVGMWHQFEDRSQLFATACLSRYRGCPRMGWKPVQWKNNPTRPKGSA